MNYVNIKKIKMLHNSPFLYLVIEISIFQKGKSPKGKIDFESECCLVYNDCITFNGHQADLGAEKCTQTDVFLLDNI